jgi:hypothetical protein
MGYRWRCPFCFKLAPEGSLNVVTGHLVNVGEIVGCRFRVGRTSNHRISLADCCNCQSSWQQALAAGRYCPV